MYVTYLLTANAAQSEIVSVVYITQCFILSWAANVISLLVIYQRDIWDFHATCICFLSRLKMVDKMFCPQRVTDLPAWPRWANKTALHQHIFKTHTNTPNSNGKTSTLEFASCTKAQFKGRNECEMHIHQRRKHIYCWTHTDTLSPLQLSL